jgi:UDP-N-acetylglucosamine 2-epimerase (non-hydrolysing)
LSGSNPINVAVIVGTRPEAIKLAPVILRLKQEESIRCVIVDTGQHRQMCAQALEAFGLVADVTLNTMVEGQSLSQLAARVLSELDHWLADEPIDWILVQGDTTTAMTAAICAFYRKIKVGHVEAGLRTFDRAAPFPEEMNRVLIGQVADVHFAPTESGRANLLAEGRDEGSILVTGNTVVDAVRLLRPLLAARQLSDFLDPQALALIDGRRLVLATCHRRESFGQGMRNICEALKALSEKFEDLVIVFPVHLNPHVQTPVRAILQEAERVILVGPLGYLDLMLLIERSTIILSDSGGLQEEAPSFGKPILVLRDTTERPEVVSVGAAKLVGADKDRIFEAACTLLTDSEVYRRMSTAQNPFGDGLASERIAQWLAAQAH